MRRLIPGRGRALVVGVALAMLALALAPGLAETLRYDRTAIAAGEVWRLVTGQLVHAGGRHLLLNVAGLLAWAVAFGSLARWHHWLVAGVTAALAVGAGLFMLQPDLVWYVGASGWLYGLVAAAAVFAAARRRWLEAAVAATLLALRLVAVVIGHGAYAPGALIDIGVPVVDAAHWLGAAGGAVAAICLAFAARRL